MAWFWFVAFVVVCVLWQRDKKRYRGSGRLESTAANPSQAGRAVQVPITSEVEQMPAAETSASDEGDSGRDPFVWIGDGDPVSANLQIEYQDSEGKVTKREVEVKRYTPTPEGGIDAYCRLRNGHRSFYYRGMKRVVDLDSGEVIQEPWAWLDARYKASPECKIVAMLGALWQELELLVYVCRADGRMQAPEREIVVDYMLKRQPGLVEAPKERLEKALKQEVATLTVVQFKRSVGECAKRADVDGARLVAAAEAIVATQKSVADEEQAAIAYLRKKLIAV